jgi:hypothetical protein
VFFPKGVRCSFHFGLIAEFPQCFSGEIRQVFTFITSLYFPKGFYSPDFSIHIVEYHRQFVIIPKLNIFTQTRKQDTFGFVTLVPVISPKQTVSFFAPFVRRAYVPSYGNHLHRDSNTGQFFRVVVVSLVISSLKHSAVVLDVFCRA